MTLRRLAAYLRPYRLHMAGVIAATLAVTLLNLAGPWILKELVALVTEGGLTETGFATVVTLAGVLLATYLLRGVAEFGKSYGAHVMAWRFVSDLRVSTYEQLQRLSLRYYQARQTGEIMSRVVNDTQHIEPLIAHNIPDLIVHGLMVLGIAGILLYLNVTLALLTLIPIPLLLGIVWVFSARMRNAFRTSQARLGDLNAILQDNISGMKEIQLFTREPDEHRRVTHRSTRYTTKLLHALKLLAIYHPGVELAAALGTVIVVFFGGRLALTGELAIADLVAFFLYLNLFYQPVMLLARMNEQVQMAMAGAERVAEVLRVEPAVQEDPRPIRLARAEGRIDFESVDFAYQEGRPVLHGIDFSIPPGGSLALVGPTGVGKSTIAALVPRFYDPTRGRVRLDGTDIRRLRLQDLRRNVSMVLQDVFLFNGTVRENILYGNPQASDDEVERAARVARAHGFIAELPEGYATQIGERGVRLSGGQKQRLAIARAVLKDAPVLILDEATSAVDIETERLIQEALDDLREGRTVITIAHRLSTVRKADQIAVLQEGRIVEMGSHEHLMRHGTAYSRLVRAQLAGAAEGVGTEAKAGTLAARPS